MGKISEKERSVTNYLAMKKSIQLFIIITFMCLNANPISAQFFYEEISIDKKFKQSEIVFLAEPIKSYSTKQILKIKEVFKSPKNALLPDKVTAVWGWGSEGPIDTSYKGRYIIYGDTKITDGEEVEIIVNTNFSKPEINDYLDYFEKYKTDSRNMDLIFIGKPIKIIQEKPHNLGKFQIKKIIKNKTQFFEVDKAEPISLILQKKCSSHLMLGRDYLVITDEISQPLDYKNKEPKSRTIMSIRCFFNTPALLDEIDVLREYGHNQRKPE